VLIGCFDVKCYPAVDGKLVLQHAGGFEEEVWIWGLNFEFYAYTTGLVPEKTIPSVSTSM